LGHLNPTATTLSAAHSHNQNSINLKESFMKNAISWFEIPSLNLEKAAEGVGGALICGPTAPVTTTSTGHGVLIYLYSSAHSIDVLLQRAVNAGGSVAMPRTALPPGMGFMASIFDLDGNKVGLHSLS
jgi:uncharacterized protein